MSEERVDFLYNFELRGDRSVERGLEGIAERFARTGNFADLASASLEKFGRIFEVGLPLAIGAAALGIVTEKLYEVGNESLKTREKIGKMVSTPLDDMDTSALQSSLGQLGDELDELDAGESGKKFGKSFLDGFKEGIRKEDWDASAFLANNVPGAAALLNFFGGDSNGHKLSTNEPSWDTNNGNIGTVASRARDELTALHDRNQDSLGRLADRGALSEKLKNVDESSPAGKATKLNSELLMSYKDVQTDRTHDDKISKEYNSFQESIADGHALTKAEVVKGAELEKTLNEERTKFWGDYIKYNEDQKAVNDFIRDQDRWRKDEVIASHSRSVGGGGSVWTGKSLRALAPDLMGPPAPPAFNPGSMNQNVMKDFTEGLRSHTDATRAQTGGDLRTTSL